MKQTIKTYSLKQQISNLSNTIVELKTLNIDNKGLINQLQQQLKNLLITYNKELKRINKVRELITY